MVTGSDLVGLLGRVAWLLVQILWFVRPCSMVTGSDLVDLVGRVAWLLVQILWVGRSCSRVTGSRHVGGTYILHRQRIRGLEECSRTFFTQQMKFVRSCYTSYISNPTAQSNKSEDRNPRL
jgi:hypothetical protein